MDTTRATTLTAVSAAPLPAELAFARPALPDWAWPAVSPPQGPRWPENERRFVLQLTDEQGNMGSYGPCSAAVIEIIRDQLAPGLLGRPCPGWRQATILPGLGRHRSGAHYRLAQAAVELALWDLRSREAATSIAALLGGPLRDRVPAYASLLGVDVDHPLAPDIARWAAEEGFWGQKWRLPGGERSEEPAADTARVQRVREAAGPQARIMVDALGLWDVSYTLRVLPALAEAAIAWLEEPTAPELLRRVAPTAERYGVPLAAGEHAYDPHEADQLTASGDLRFLQPDPAWHGGLAPTLRTVEAAASRGMRCVPHGSCLPAVIQLAAVTAEVCVPAVEYHLTMAPRRAAVLIVPPVSELGWLVVPTSPGLTVGYRTVPNATPLLLAGERDVA